MVATDSGCCLLDFNPSVNSCTATISSAVSPSATSLEKVSIGSQLKYKIILIMVATDSGCCLLVFNPSVTSCTAIISSAVSPSATALEKVSIRSQLKYKIILIMVATDSCCCLLVFNPSVNSCIAIISSAVSPSAMALEKVSIGSQLKYKIILIMVATDSGCCLLVFNPSVNSCTAIISSAVRPSATALEKKIQFQQSN